MPEYEKLNTGICFVSAMFVKTMVAEQAGVFQFFKNMLKFYV